MTGLSGTSSRSAQAFYAESRRPRSGREVKAEDLEDEAKRLMKITKGLQQEHPLVARPTRASTKPNKDFIAHGAFARPLAAPRVRAAPPLGLPR